MAFATPTDEAPSRPVAGWALALRVTALGLALGALIQLVVFGAAALAESLAGARPTAATALAFLGWSSVACVVITYARVALRAGALGMVAAGAGAATLGVVASLAVSWAVATAMTAPAAVGTTGALLSGGWKAVEYGALGAVVVALGQRRQGALAHAAVGLAWGLLFGGAFLVLLHILVGPLSLAALASRGTTELLFPVGCAVLLWWEGRVLS